MQPLLTQRQAAALLCLSERTLERFRTHELLQMVYRGEISVTPQQMQAARESIAYEKPKLTAVAHFEGSFYEALERAIEKRANRPPPSLMIDAKPVEPQPAEVLKKPFSRLRRV
jgi:hypothetical protein